MFMRILSLFSGGFDSPVAAYLMAKKGYDVHAVYIHNCPATCEETLLKATEGMERMKELGYVSKRYVLSKGYNIGEHFEKYEKYLCILAKITMIKIVERFAKSLGIGALCSGDNLGSKSSQTGKNLAITSSYLTLPMFRPLLTFNKQEIINTSRRIGMYDISSVDDHCCSSFPKKQTAYGDQETVKSILNEINMEELIKKAMRDVR